MKYRYKLEVFYYIFANCLLGVNGLLEKLCTDENLGL